MAYFNVCANCGARLDPGERCDCDIKREVMPDSDESGITHTRPSGTHKGYAGKAEAADGSTVRAVAWGG
jgi:hypothetical protein